MVAGVETREVRLDGNSDIKSYGTLDCGAELMRFAWPSLDHKFSVRRQLDSEFPEVEHVNTRRIGGGPHRFPRKLLSRNPVDLLVVDRGFQLEPPHDYRHLPWEELVTGTPQERRPEVIIEVWGPSSHLWGKGPMNKACVSRWANKGFQSYCRMVRAVDVGGAIRQNRLIIARVKSGRTWNWDTMERGAEVIRPMSNLLTPPGLVRKSSYVEPPSYAVPDAMTDPMPNRVGALIRTERGIRRLSVEEVARGLGVPKISEKQVSSNLLSHTTSVFHWEYLSYSVSATVKAHDDARTAPTARSHRTALGGETENPAKEPPSTEFSWVPPSLDEGGPWYEARLRNLLEAVQSFPDPEVAFKEGLEHLRNHRRNYNAEGPSPEWLQILWWEFPQEHWEELRRGCRQNFLHTPEPGIHPNAPMDEEMELAAAAFVDELVSLGVVRKIDEGKEVLTSCPLFVVPKEGQEGQWRVIADMLRGGQNSCVGQDPCYLPRATHILDEMYPGGYSAVVDLSKYFYNFPTHPEDRPYLGLVHPLTDELYCYYGMPMGGGQSPSSACRYGLSFVRLLRERFAVFQGKATANCWWTGFSATGFDPALGYGYTLIGRDGAAVKIWVWVDDFLIHGPTLSKTEAALRHFLDTAVECGFLFHTKKLVPPQQVVKYCGFLFDTKGSPCLRIPVPKRERALAICEYLLAAPPTTEWSRLSLAVAAGILESLSEGTPRRLGHTHLRNLHSLVHPPDSGTGRAPYFTKASLTTPVRQELSWWVNYLHVGEGRYARPSKAGTLVPTFGDGSGTGTGGTFVLPAGPLQMWRGKWSPVVFRFSAVWKELATLKETLIRLREHSSRSELHNTTVFYFTDNSGVYWICSSGSSRSPGLHRLLQEIRCLELSIGCTIQTVHVPGLIMIMQGTDGLSRGIWLSSLHQHMDGDRLTRAIFDPLPFDPTLVWEVIPQLSHPSQQWVHYSWNQEWKASFLFHKLSVWFPPPEIARQALSFFLNTWVEQPLTTSALFFIPRTLEGSWRGLSRYVQELKTIFPHETPLRFPPVLPIPIVVLYIAPHQRSLPTDIEQRLERPADPAGSRWHREQAALMRGMPPKHF